MLVRRNVVGVFLAALTLAFYKAMLMGSNVVGIFFSALALAFYKAMLVGSVFRFILLAADEKHKKYGKHQ